MGIHLRRHADGSPVLRVSQRHVGHRPQWLEWNLAQLQAQGVDVPSMESCRLCIATTPKAMADHDAAVQWLMRRMGARDQERH